MITDLPPEWAFCTLQDLVLIPLQDIVDGPFGSRLRASEYQESGIPVIRIQNIERNRFVEKTFNLCLKKKPKN